MDKADKVEDINNENKILQDVSEETALQSRQNIEDNQELTDSNPGVIDDAIEFADEPQEYIDNASDFVEDVPDVSRHSYGNGPGIGQRIDHAIGTAVDNAGRAIQTAGTGIENTGKTIEGVGHATELGGKTTQLAGSGMDLVGQGLNQAGQALTGTEVGAVVGIPLTTIGSATSGMGQATKTAGQTVENAGKGMVQTGKNVKETGKKVKQLGNQTSQAGQMKKNLSSKNADNKYNEIMNKQKNRRLKQLNRNKKLLKKALSTATPAGGMIADSVDKSTGLFGKDTKAKGELKIPLKVKIIFYGAIAGICLVLLMIFILFFGDEETIGGGTSGTGSYTYGGTACTTLTITDTGCDSEGKNCTNIHNGDVDIEDYVAGVVAAEADGANNLEYYKLIAIKARTYLYSNIGSKCNVKGNTDFQEYVSIDSSSDSALIKQAVEETKDQVLVEDEKIVDISYNNGKVVNEDDTNYYIEYYTTSSSDKKTQTIPKTWSDQSIHKTYLSNWQTDGDKSSKGISLIGANYLISSENYTYEDTIKFYYGEETTIEENKMKITGINGFVNPTGTIYCSSPFGYRIHPVKKVPKLHTGIDIAIPGGEPIYAAADGIVTRVVNNISAINNCNYGYGNQVVIEHADGLSTLYAHIMYGTIPTSLKVGDIVKQGEQIGQVGSTGCSTGNHLHYEVKINGVQVDPSDYLDLTNATGRCIHEDKKG